jgi:hypothetical protein
LEDKKNLKTIRVLTLEHAHDPECLAKLAREL